MLPAFFCSSIAQFAQTTAKPECLQLARQPKIWPQAHASFSPAGDKQGSCCYPSAHRAPVQGRCSLGRRLLPEVEQRRPKSCFDRHRTSRGLGKCCFILSTYPSSHQQHYGEKLTRASRDPAASVCQPQGTQGLRATLMVQRDTCIPALGQLWSLLHGVFLTDVTPAPTPDTERRGRPCGGDT